MIGVERNADIKRFLDDKNAFDHPHAVNPELFERQVDRSPDAVDSSGSLGYPTTVRGGNTESHEYHGGSPAPHIHYTSEHIVDQDPAQRPSLWCYLSPP